jgi:hypothetical protein
MNFVLGNNRYTLLASLTSLFIYMACPFRSEAEVDATI